MKSCEIRVTQILENDFRHVTDHYKHGDNIHEQKKIVNSKTDESHSFFY